MSIDHAISLEENIPSINQAPPWRLALRFHPALLNSEGAEKISAATEQLLLVMHCTSKKLLVISNKSIAIYQIPSYDIAKTGWRKQLAVVVAVIKLVLAFVPLVGELIDGLEKLMSPLEWIWHRISGKARKEREEALELILSYEDIFLLTNIFNWKTKFKAPFVIPVHEPITITVEWSGIRIAVGRKKAFATYLDNSWGPLKSAANLIEKNRQALEAAGWSVQTANQGYVFKNFK